jgi:preprotein translocase subunit SecF
VTDTTEVAAPKRSIFYRLYHGETSIDFVGRFRLWIMCSGVVIVAGLVALGINGLNLGIDFKGGTVWEVDAGKASVTAARDAVETAGLADPKVQTLTAESTVRLRVQAETADRATQDKIADVLAKLTGSKADDVNINSVGASWGSEISKKALRALIFFLIAIAFYITFRFELKMAIPTLVALVHDILITIGVYALFGFEVTPATVIAVLTILGYSIYDGIVVFDKVDENTKLVSSSSGMTYSGMVNLSLNQVLMRSLNTSITALLPVASLLVIGSVILGAVTLREFALALLVGIFAGAYSSIFIASPMLAVMKEREKRYHDIRQRVEARTARATPATPTATTPSTASSGSESDATPATVPGGLVDAQLGPELSGRVIPPRPRKKTRRR